jgi:hypothetical protein
LCCCWFFSCCRYYVFSCCYLGVVVGSHYTIVASFWVVDVGSLHVVITFGCIHVVIIILHTTIDAFHVVVFSSHYYCFPLGRCYFF